MDIIIANGQQANKTEAEKDEFYKQLQTMIEDTPKKNAMIIAGDMNAKALRPTSDLEEKVMGKYTIYTQNKEKNMAPDTRDNRERLIKLCLENGLKLMNTMFKKPVEQLATHKPLYTKDDTPIAHETHDQIDYIMMRDKDKMRTKRKERATLSMSPRER